MDRRFPRRCVDDRLGNWRAIDMEDDKSLLEHITDGMAEFATRAKKAAKKVKRTMAGRPPKKTKSSAGRKAVGALS